MGRDRFRWGQFRTHSWGGPRLRHGFHVKSHDKKEGWGPTPQEPLRPGLRGNTNSACRSSKKFRCPGHFQELNTHPREFHEQWAEIGSGGASFGHTLGEDRDYATDFT